MFTHPPRRGTTLAIGLTAIAALALTGCGRSATDAPDSSLTIDDSPATGAVQIWAPDGDATVVDDVLASYQADNPDLEIEFTLIPADEYRTKLQAAIAAGTGPDIAQLYTEAQVQFIDGGAFAPVPDGLVEPSDFFTGAWDSGVVDGVAYSVPWYAYTYALVYRSDLAETAGVEAPTTWEETVPFFSALQDAGAGHGLGAEVGWGVYNGQDVASYVWQAGGELLSEDGTEWTLDTPEVVDALEFNASYFTSGVASLDGPGFLDAQPYFVEGKTAAMITGPWVLGSLDGVAGEEDWVASHVATVPVPAGPNGNVGAIAGGSWGVLADSDNAEAAWKVIRQLSAPETQVAQFEAYSSLPAIESAWDDPAIADQPLLTAFFAQLQSTRTYPQVASWAEVATQLGAEIEAVAKGVKTAEQAAADIQAFADGLGTE